MNIWSTSPDAPGLPAVENGSPFGPHTPDHPNSPVPRYCHPGYSPALLSSTPCGEDDQCSVASQDSGIPTLEINPPEHVNVQPFSPNDDGPATLTLESTDGTLHKSSTFPRSSLEWRLFSPPGGVRAGGGALNRSDDISVCSVSSLSTELSATLSLSNDDIVDFMVTSDSSAVVTFENSSDAVGGAPRYTDVPLPPSDSLPQSHQGALAPEELRPKRTSPIMSFINRNLFSKKLKAVADGEGPREPGWRLFGRVSPSLSRDPRGALKYIGVSNLSDQHVQTVRTSGSSSTLTLVYFSLPLLRERVRVRVREGVLCWCGAGSVLVLCWCGAGSVLVLCWCGAGAVLVLCWCGAGAVLVLCWCSAGSVLVLCWCGAGSVLVRCWCGAGSVLVLCWCGAGSVLVLCWFCAGSVLVRPVRIVFKPVK
ncbi:hypothetical protein NFI96_015955 [Prochilodus magdalenae]|nr:hypothetical protein NFI96_015955 [Prochilodus magdalenae]